MVKKPDLKLLHGGMPRNFFINGTRIMVSPFPLYPFKVEAIVFEEDTHLVLTVDKKFVYKKEHPIRMMTNIMNSKTHKPGSLVINGKNWYAVVVDVNAADMCQPQWIEQAYVKIFTRIKKTGINSIGIYLLGTSHVQTDIQKSLELFLKSLEYYHPKCLKTIWLIVSEQNIPLVTKALRNRKE